MGSGSAAERQGCQPGEIKHHRGMTGIVNVGLDAKPYHGREYQHSAG
jgi:hypothetical protein